MSSDVAVTNPAESTVLSMGEHCTLHNLIALGADLGKGL